MQHNRGYDTQAEYITSIRIGNTIPVYGETTLLSLTLSHACLTQEECKHDKRNILTFWVYDIETDNYIYWERQVSFCQYNIAQIDRVTDENLKRLYKVMMIGTLLTTMNIHNSTTERVCSL